MEAGNPSDEELWEACRRLLADWEPLGQRRWHGRREDRLRIPMKVVSDSDLIPVTCSEVKAVVFGAKRRWRSYRA